MPKIYLYVRCSHTDSAESGLGLDAQLSACLRYAEFIKATRHPDLQIVTKPFVDEKVSAYQKPTRRFISRKAGGRLVGILQPGDHVVFARLDRAFRHPPDFYATYELFASKGVTMHFADMQLDLGSAIGMVMAGFMATIAHWWSNYISERTKEGLAQRRLRNEIRADDKRIPFGKRISQDQSGKAILVNNEEMMILSRYVRVLRDQHKLSLGKIAQRIERIMAKREGRKPKPEWDSPKYHAKGVSRMWRLAAEYWPDRYPQVSKFPDTCRNSDDDGIVKKRRRRQRTLAEQEIDERSPMTQIRGL